MNQDDSKIRNLKIRLVLENSGVAEPQKLRDKFNEAIEDGHPIMDRIRLNTMVLASLVFKAFAAECALLKKLYNEKIRMATVTTFCCEFKVFTCVILGHISPAATTVCCSGCRNILRWNLKSLTAVQGVDLNYQRPSRSPVYR